MTKLKTAGDLNTFRRAVESGEHIYHDPNDRYVVSLVASYCPERDGVQSPEAAAAAALRLTTDEGAPDTHWQVYDRATGLMHTFEQSEFEDVPVP